MDSITQEVEIFDQAYSLCGPDPEYIRKLAAYVNSTMRTIANEDATVDRAQLVVVAAVRIADEYHRLKKTEEDRQRTRERRQRHYTKRRYEKELLAIVNDESVPAKERHEALFILGRVKGYHRRPTGKR